MGLVNLENHAWGAYLNHERGSSDEQLQLQEGNGQKWGGLQEQSSPHNQYHILVWTSLPQYMLYIAQ